MQRNQFSFLFIFFLISIVADSQDFTVPELPNNKEEYIRSEPDMINAAKWLENTPLGTQKEKRVQVNTYILQWITSSPIVQVDLDADLITKICEGNGDMLFVFLSGYAKYCLENSYTRDQLKGATAGLKAIINCHALGGDIKKNKQLSKVIDADKEGKLEEWVKGKLKTE